MIAAQTFNAREDDAQDGAGGPVYGAVTIGELWKFLTLEGATVQIDSHSYHIEHVGKILGILLFLATGGA